MELLKIQNLNFVHGLATRSTNFRMTTSPKWAWSEPRDAFYNYKPLEISVKRHQILCACRLYQVLAFGRLTIPEKGVARFT